MILFYNAHKEQTELRSLLSSLQCVKCGDAAVFYSSVEKVERDENNFLFGRTFTNTYEQAHSVNCPVDEFCSEYWGQCFLVNICKDGVNVVRASDCLIPIFYVKTYNNGVIVSTDISLLVKVTHASFNWGYLQSYVVIGSSVKKCTAFDGIKELQFGCILHADSFGGEMRTGVDVRDVTSTRGKTLNASEQIADTLLNVIRCELRDKTGKLFIDFSGGLDSTAVLFTLREALGKNVDIIAVNVYNKYNPASNELSYASKIAEICEANLLAFENSHEPSFSPYGNLAVKPFAPDMGFMRLATELAICKEAGITADDIVFTGQGGDHVFMCPPARESLVDAFIESGISEFQKKLKELAITYRISMFKELHIFRKYLFKYLLHKNYEDICYLNAVPVPWFKGTISHKDCGSEHYFMERNYSLLPGKYYQSDSIMIGLSEMCTDIRAYNVLNRGQIKHPLFSWPIIKLGLSIPAYDLYNSEYDRLPYRRSIADRYSTPYVWRKDKGEVTGELLRAVRRNQKRVMELCLEGRFACMNMLDKDMLYKELQQAISGKGDELQINTIMNLYNVECFLECWQEIKQ